MLFDLFMIVAFFHFSILNIFVLDVFTLSTCSMIGNLVDFLCGIGRLNVTTLLTSFYHLLSAF